MSPLLAKESSPRLNVTIRPSGDKLGASTESLKFVIGVYSDGEVTGSDGSKILNSPMAAASTKIAKALPAAIERYERGEDLDRRSRMGNAPELLFRATRFRSAFISEAC